MIILDYRDKRPIYEQVVEKLSGLIACGVLEAESKLPSVRALSMELSINPNTIQRAYQELEQAGYTYCVKGRGNFVAGDQEWRNGRQSKIFERAKEVALEARNAGIQKELWIQRMAEYYEEGARA